MADVFPGFSDRWTFWTGITVTFLAYIHTLLVLLLVLLMSTFQCPYDLLIITIDWFENRRLEGKTIHKAGGKASWEACVTLW